MSTSFSFLKVKFSSKITCFFIFVSFFLNAACTQNIEGETEHKKFSIYILGKDSKEYLVQTDDLSHGELQAEKDGVELDKKKIGRDVIVKGGFYYHLSKKQHTFSKYVKTRNSLKEIASLPIKDFSIENFYWLSKDTLLLIGLDYKTYTTARYYKIATKNFTLLATGDLPIPKPYSGFESTSLGITKLIEDKLIIAYTYHKHLGPASYKSSDTIYVASLNYPAMTLAGIEKDTRSSYPGGINTIQSYSFDTEKGDFYFMSCPGIALGNMPNIPTAIFRIKKGENLIDKSYLFNISTSKINNHAYGIWYLGNNKAIIRSERNDLYKDFSDHAGTAHFEFYVIDLITQSVNKLNLPLDKGTRRECVLVEGDTAYIAINSTNEGNFIWLYNTVSGTLKKGLKLSGDTDYIYRIDKN